MLRLVISILEISLLSLSIVADELFSKPLATVLPSRSECRGLIGSSLGRGLLF